ncbi:MAG: ABC transporter [Candidatus Portnoybacteria bacterium CG06_land_8_20_14_3_00_39_12]|uniref:ABC transporter n=1 Tax=Candidatus Portnoybacteria bacterium CG06_land_8_20_14_3_00_39_12 TaxID=1974809 RepID=A0A2M7AY75_9BACT|nr:MAG: ABC transporter [Candidatus Portnoybacteria bacterium CG06_land_8_20_14_3_00_39_12]
MKFHRINAIIWRHIYGTHRTLHRLVDLFYWPTLDLVLWGFMATYFTRAGQSAFNLMAFLLGAMILWGILIRSQQDVSISFMEEVWSRNLLNIFGSPLSVPEFLTAAFLLSLIRIIIVFAFMGLLSWLLYAFNILTFSFYLIPFWLNLLIFGWTIGIVAMAIILRFGQRFNFIAWSLPVLIQPVSAVFYPLSVLPGFLQKIGLALPTTYVFEGMRQVITTHQLSISHLALAFGLNLLYLILGCLFFVIMYRSVRKKGLLSKLE